MSFDKLEIVWAMEKLETRLDRLVGYVKELDSIEAHLRDISLMMRKLCEDKEKKSK